MSKKPSLQSAPLGASLVVLSSLICASYGIWTKLMGNFFGAYTASAIRSLLILIILIPVALLYRQLKSFEWRKNWRYFVGVVAASMLVWGPLYFAILYAGVGVSLAINYASLVIGMFVLGWLFAGEKLTKDKWLSIILGLIGLALIFWPSLEGIGLMALGASVVSGLGMAANSILAKKIPYGTTQTTIFFYGAAVLANLIALLLLKEPMPAIGLYPEWLWLIIFGLASLAASWTLIKGIKLIEAGAAGVLGLLEIVFALLFGIVLFGERPSWIVWIGAFTIIIAAAIPYIKDYNAKRGTLS